MIFRKSNPIPGSDSLLCERRGLELLARALEGQPVKIPKIHKCTEEELHLDHIECESSPGADSVRDLAWGLAGLHRTRGGAFGFEHDGYIGRSRQINGKCGDWGVFFLEMRLNMQVSWIRDKNLRERLQAQLLVHGQKLTRFLNAHKPEPCLVHGDLWSGNVLYSGGGVYLIDPAAYYGDREVDLAMSKMFGGFPVEFYQEYDRAHARPRGFEVREIIYNTYHYLNHYNLFGASYLGDVMQGFKAIEKLQNLQITS